MREALRFQILDAVRENNANLVLDLIGKGAPLNDPIDVFPLLEAAYCGHVSLIRLLVEYGADVNLQADDNGDYDTSLMWAAMRGNLDAVRVLVELGADVNARNMYQETAFSMAKFNGHRDVCNYLCSL